MSRTVTRACSLRLRPSEASAMEVGTGRGSVQHSPAQIKEETRRVLTTMSIVGVCYFAVSGGPIGSEYVVSGACFCLPLLLCFSEA